MSLRLATFNVENLMNRFDFSGYRNELRQDRAVSLYRIEDEDQYRQLEQARMVAHTDDTRQLTALAIAQTHADIVCLQEVDNLDALNAFEYGYLFKMTGNGYRHKYLSSGNDSRGIDVALMLRDETRDGEQIEFVEMTSHAHLTYRDLDLHNPELEETGNERHERIFRRDCLEIDVRVGGRPLTLYLVHFKSMGGWRDGKPGREVTMPVRVAEAKAVRHIIEQRFGRGTPDKRWVICGDLNDYRERIAITGDSLNGYNFAPHREKTSSVDVLMAEGFCENVVERRPEMDRWTLYHTNGRDERHLCQLDYILLSPSLARRNPNTVPDIIRSGQPFRTLFPEGQEVDRFPRTGWDRPKASDHCPVCIKLDMT